VQYHASTVAHPPNSPPQNDTKGSMVDISQGVYRPHWVNQTTRALSDQHICRHPTRVPSAA